MTTQSELERVARAICEASGEAWREGTMEFATGPNFEMEEHSADPLNNHWRHVARAAIEAIHGTTEVGERAYRQGYRDGFEDGRDKFMEYHADVENEGWHNYRAALAQTTPPPPNGDIREALELEERLSDLTWALRSDLTPSQHKEAINTIADAAKAIRKSPNGDIRNQALEEIIALERQEFAFPADWQDQINACPECKRYQGHPIQQGICDEHRRPLWDREKHDSHEQKALIYRAKDIAREALKSPKGE